MCLRKNRIKFQQARLRSTDFVFLLEQMWQILAGNERLGTIWGEKNNYVPLMPTFEGYLEFLVLTDQRVKWNSSGKGKGAVII